MAVTPMTLEEWRRRRRLGVSGVRSSDAPALGTQMGARTTPSPNLGVDIGPDARPPGSVFATMDDDVEEAPTSRGVAPPITPSPQRPVAPSPQTSFGQAPASVGSYSTSGSVFATMDGSNFSLGDLDISWSLPGRMLANGWGDVKEMKDGLSAIMGMALDKAVFTARHPIQSALETPEQVVRLAEMTWEGVKEDFSEYVQHPIRKTIEDPLFVLFDIGGLASGGSLLVGKVAAKAAARAGAKSLASGLVRAGEVIGEAAPSRLAVRGARAGFKLVVKRIPKVAEAAARVQLPITVQRLWRDARSFRQDLQSGAVRTAFRAFGDLEPEEKAIMMKFATGRDVGNFPISDRMREAADAWRSINEPWQRTIINLHLVKPEVIEKNLWTGPMRELGVETREQLFEYVGLREEQQLIRPGDIATAREAGFNVIEFSEALSRAKAVRRGVDDRLRVGVQHRPSSLQEAADNLEESLALRRPDILPPSVKVIAPSFMSGMLQAQIKTRRVFGNVRALLRGDAPESTILAMEAAAAIDVAEVLGKARKVPMGDVGVSGEIRKPSFLSPRKGLTIGHAEELTDIDVLVPAMFFERTALMSKWKLINDITDQYAFKIVPSQVVGKGKERVVERVRMTAPKSSIMDDVDISIEEYQELLDRGFDWQGQRYKGVTWAPDYFKQAQAMTIDTMEATLVGLRQKLSVEEALGKALEGVVISKGKGRVTSLPKATAKNPLYIIPKPVAKNLQHLANIGSYPAGVLGFGMAVYDDVTDFYRRVWLNTPRFVVNNNASNALVALLSGINVRDMWEASQKKYRPFLDDIPGLTVNQISSELSSPTLLGRASEHPVRNFLELIRQKAVFHAFGSTFEVINRRTEDFWRRAAFIHETRKVTGALTNDVEIERLARNMSQKVKGMSKEDILRKLVGLKQNILEGALLDDLTKRIDFVKGSPELFHDAIGFVNKWYFDYFALLPEERQVMRRILPFWNWQKNIHKLMVSLPVSHPGRTLLASHFGALANDLTDQEELPQWLKGSTPLSVDPDYRVRGSNLSPIRDLFDLGGFHPILTYAMSVTTGGKVFPPGGRYTDENIVQGLTGQYRVDPESGEVIGTVEVVRPTPQQYFLSAIPVANMMLETTRAAVDTWGEGEIKHYAQQVFGESPTVRTSGGLTYTPGHRLQSTYSWLSVPLAPKTPSGWERVWRREISRMSQRVQRHKERYPDKGIVGRIFGR